MPDNTHTPRSNGGEARTIASPPYFRLDDPAERQAFAEKGYAEVLAPITDGSLHRGGSDLARNLAEAFADAGVVPRDAVPTREDLDGFFEEQDQESPDLDDALDGSKRQQQQFDLFRNITHAWREHGIGDVRAVYYFYFLASDHFHEDPAKMGGFPPTPHGRAGNYLTRFHGYRVGARARDWLAYDAFLSEALGHLGISWLTLEDAITGAFRRSLPSPYRPFLKGVPGPLMYVFWRHDLERWQGIQRYSERIVKTTQALDDLLTKMRQGYAAEFGPYVERLRQAAQLDAWMVRAAGDLPQYGKLTAPTVKAVYRALADALAEGTMRGFRRGGLADDAPAFVRRIYDRQAAGPEQKAREFWMLCADIMRHLTIARGVLEGYYPSGDARPPTYHSENAVRLLVARS